MKCPECGTVFEKTRTWQRYDKLECGVKARNRKRAKRVKRALRASERRTVQMETAIAATETEVV